MKKLLFIFSCIYALFSCTGNKTDFLVIDIQKGSINKANLSEIVDTIIVVPLETTDESLISENFRLKRDDSLLFIEYDGIIYLFGIDGKFHKQLTKKGNGPGEARVFGYDLDREKKILLVNGQGGKMISYNYDGALISEKRHDLIYLFRPFAFYDNSFWAEAHPIDDNESWLLRYNKEWELQDSIKLFTPVMPIKMFSYAFSTGFSVVNNSLYLNRPSHQTDYFTRDTLFRVVGDKIIPELRVNYGNFTYRTHQDPFKSGYPIQPSAIRISERFLLTCYLIDNEQDDSFDSYLFCFDFTSEKQYNLKGGFEDDIFNTGKVIPLPLDIYHKEFYFTKTTGEISELFPTRDESDNPVLFIMRLKE